MTLTTTFKLLRNKNACKPKYKLLRAALKGTKDNEPINLLTILETNGLDDAIWALCATAENCDKIVRLMAADFAEQVLPIWQAHSQDKRPELAIKAARDFAHGLITIADLNAAKNAAWDAAKNAAWDASWAAWAAKSAAAWDAWGAVKITAWATAKDTVVEKQKEIFTSYLQP